jgi:hypothetical protein
VDERVEHPGDRQRRRTEGHLVAGGFAVLALGGGAILWWRYGGTTAGIALAMIVLAAGVLILLWLFLSALEWWARSG